jgi:hypothetical protein
LEIEKKLKEGGGINKYSILITLRPESKIKTKKFIDLIVQFLLQELKNISFHREYLIKEDKIRVFNQKLAEYVSWILIEKKGSLKVNINQWLIDPQYLPIRVLQTIKEDKEKKSYQEFPIWLVIFINDSISPPDDIEKAIHSLKIKVRNSRFERIYLQLTYCPDTKNYPLFRIK